LRIDPEEQDNLIKNPAYQDRLDDLKHELKEYLDKLPGKFGEFKTK
jgi:hypothetical protein